MASTVLMNSVVDEQQIAALDSKAVYSDTSLIIRRLPWRFAAIPVLIFSIELIAMQLVHLLMPDAGEIAQAIADALFISVGISIPLWLLIPRPLARALAREHAAVATSSATLVAEMHRQQFEARLQRALEMAVAEPDALRVLQRAMVHVAGAMPVSLMLADSSQAHLRQVAASVRSSPHASPGGESEAEPQTACSVRSPSACIAARQGQVMAYDDSEAIDACPCLVDRAGPPVTAVCVPISIAGKTIGVLHSCAPRNTPFSSGLIASLRVVAAQAGARLGVIRTMSASQLAATTDPLTGLLNRRSLEEKVGMLLAADRPFALVMTDLDHFKNLNDTFSHGVGDRAIKVFARCLKHCCRGDDLVARIGGEEFAVVLPDLEAEQAAEVMERVRASLPSAEMHAGTPPFTATFGIADQRHDAEFEGILQAADHALYAAKEAGRDRIVIAGTVIAAGTNQTAVGTGAITVPSIST